MATLGDPYAFTAFQLPQFPMNSLGKWTLIPCKSEELSVRFQSQYCLKIWKILLGTAILLLGTGAVLLANATIIPHKTLTSSTGFSVHDTGSGQWFELMSGGLVTPSNPWEFTVGTNGTGSVLVMKA